MTHTQHTTAPQPAPQPAIGATAAVAKAARDELYAKRMALISLSCMVVGFMASMVTMVTGDGSVPAPLSALHYATLVMTMISGTTYAALRQQRVRKQK